MRCEQVREGNLHLINEYERPIFTFVSDFDRSVSESINHHICTDICPCYLLVNNYEAVHSHDEAIFNKFGRSKQIEQTDTYLPMDWTSNQEFSFSNMMECYQFLYDNVYTTNFAYFREKFDFTRHKLTQSMKVLLIYLEQ